MAEKEPLSTPPKEASGEKPLRVRRGRVASVDLYEIKDTELDLLERGSPTGIHLNFSVFLLSVAFSSLVALCTATSFKPEVIQTVFVVLLLLGMILGGFFIILWYKGRTDVRKVIQGIRNRIPPEVAPMPAFSSTVEMRDTEPQPREEDSLLR